MDSQTGQRLQKLLRSARLRVTGPRVAILGVLSAADKPVTHEQIRAALGPKGPNKVTIYRVLDRLLAAGLVHKAFLQERTWHFELAANCSRQQCHPHFNCTSCGSTHCLTEMSPEMAQSPYKGFIIQRQQIQLEGLCPDCNTAS